MAEQVDDACRQRFPEKVQHVMIHECTTRQDDESTIELSA
jgi:hypothetical protein